MIIPGIASQALAAEIANSTGRELMPVERKHFPDGERLVSLEDAPGSEAVIVGSTTSSTAHIDLLLLQDAARESGAKTITTVIPYLGYARQDKAFDAGQPISVRAVARAISSGTDRVITVNPHEESALRYFDVPSEAIDVAYRLAEPLSPDLTDPLFLAPDEGATTLATSLRDAYGTGEVDHLEKTRLSGREVEIKPTDADVAHRDVIVIDDIIATGGTVAKATRQLRERGASRIVATCIHPLLAEDAYIRLLRAGVDEIYGTDTLERHVSAISAAPGIAELL